MSWIHRTETETAGAVGGGHRRVRASLAFGLTAVLLGAAAACTAPPEPPPACPARQQVVLEPTDPVAFSLARAVSPNGAHMVLSRVLGSDLVLSLRSVQPGSPSTVVGSMPAAPTDRNVLVGVDDAGSRVVFGREGTAATPADPPSVLHRWTASTGSVTDIAAPTVAAPPPGVAYPPNARAISADGRRIVWTQSFREGPEPYIWHLVVTVTDAGTDAVTAQWESSGWVLYAGTWVSSGGHQTLDAETMVSLDTGQRTDLGPDVAAARAAFPGPGLGAVAVSDDGVHLVLQGRDSFGNPGVLTTVLWDRSTGTGVKAPDSTRTYRPEIVGVSNSGEAVQAVPFNNRRDLADVGVLTLDGRLIPIGTAALQVWPAGYSSVYAVSTPDLRTVLLTFEMNIGYTLVAQRCS